MELVEVIFSLLVEKKSGAALPLESHVAQGAVSGHGKDLELDISVLIDRAEGGCGISIFVFLFRLNIYLLLSREIEAPVSVGDYGRCLMVNFLHLIEKHRKDILWRVGSEEAMCSVCLRGVLLKAEVNRVALLSSSLSLRTIKAVDLISSRIDEIAPVSFMVLLVCLFALLVCLCSLLVLLMAHLELFTNFLRSCIVTLLDPWVSDNIRNR